VGIEIEGNVSGVKTVVSDQWPVVSKIRSAAPPGFYWPLTTATDHFCTVGTQQERKLTQWWTQQNEE
jgi:hypothetical protein